MAKLIRLKQIESGSNLTAAAGAGATFSSSVLNVLNGSTLNNITIGTKDADSYSLIISGAVAIVNANNLPTGSIGDDTNVPGQIWLNGSNMVSGSTPPIDPSVNGIGVSNVIDQGEW